MQTTQQLTKQTINQIESIVSKQWESKQEETRQALYEQYEEQLLTKISELFSCIDELRKAKAGSDDIIHSLYDWNVVQRLVALESKINQE